jgi:hypothetical protein
LLLAVNLPRFWWVNRAEAAATRRGQTSDTAFATSITIVARMPEAEQKERLNSENDSPRQEEECDLSPAGYAPAVIRS